MCHLISLALVLATSGACGNDPSPVIASTSASTSASGAGGAGGAVGQGGSAVGSECADVAGCETGFCVDGVCCDRSCDAACEWCNAAGAAGNCVAFDAGIDDDCGDLGCSGVAGACMAEHVWSGGYEIITEGAYYARLIAAAEKEAGSSAQAEGAAWSDLSPRPAPADQQDSNPDLGDDRLEDYLPTCCGADLALMRR